MAHPFENQVTLAGQTNTHRRRYRFINMAIALHPEGEALCKFHLLGGDHSRGAPKPTRKQRRILGRGIRLARRMCPRGFSRKPDGSWMVTP